MTALTQDGITLLMMAAQRERADIVKILLQRGADTYAKNEVFLVEKCDGCEGWTVRSY